MNIHGQPISSQTPYWFERVSDCLIRYCLPIGWLILLTGLFWVVDHSLYSKLYYAFLFFPTILAVGLNPFRLRNLLACPLLVLFVVFACYTMLSILWSGMGGTPFDKSSLYILFLFLAARLIDFKEPGRLDKLTEMGSVGAALAALVSIAYFFYLNKGGQFTGFGALSNSLISSHVFGFFCAYWLARWWLCAKPSEIGPIIAGSSLFVLLSLSGERTPLLALFACLSWLAFLSWKRRFVSVVVVAIVVVLAVHMSFSIEGLISRGMSYRLAIWAEGIRQIKERLWFGHGYTYPQVLLVDVGGGGCYSVHNIELSVLFSGGIVGLVIWLSMYAFAFILSWRNRAKPAVIIASTLLVYGLVAGLTEGTSFFSRPKEHWFLIWIPLALLSAATYKTRTDGQEK